MTKKCRSITMLQLESQSFRHMKGSLSLERVAKVIRGLPAGA